jgi:hypothetical protein
VPFTPSASPGGEAGPVDHPAVGVQLISEGQHVPPVGGEDPVRVTAGLPDATDPDAGDSLPQVAAGLVPASARSLGCSHRSAGGGGSYRRRSAAAA